MVGVFLYMQRCCNFALFNKMVINLSTTNISFYPFVTFENVTTGGATEYLLQQDGYYILQQDGSKIISSEGGGIVDVQVWHKNTKTLVQANATPVEAGSKITVALPSLTDIADVAQDLDVCLIRVFDGDTLLWEYLATWSNESTNINKTFKEWQTTSNISPQWITL